ncbi:hydroxypyruvate isomerase family protein [Pseudoroseicyclus tamaricis]|uniref:TIM barrel protein n=1 Tax=Pseudoroseicyclus tamaricis TaxID=2705421 RepID=A0A6B2JNR4_9RHOB|nr:TIM barrel protein [Pseudoroseicyclus tamaricis]NDU99677.1 TIM barrel protein [Pseudoroseicyclus tamaricis]
MPRFAACLASLWPGLSLTEAAGRAADAGFDAVEVTDPYSAPIPELAEELRLRGLAVSAIACPPPNYTGGQRGFAAVPGLEVRFKGDLRRALRYVKALGAQNLILMAGEAEGEAARQTLLANLAHAREQPTGTRLLIRPVSPRRHPGAMLGDLGLAEEVVRQVGPEKLGLVFDAWHIHEMTGDVAGTWARLHPLVGHVQVAGYPGGHEPAGGEIDYPAFFAQMDESGYKGWVTGNYRPGGTVEAGLGWRAARGG